MKKLAAVLVGFLAFNAHAQLNLLDTLKKGADALQNLNTAPQGQTNSPTKPAAPAAQANSNQAPQMPVAKSGGVVTNQNIKDVLPQFDKKYQGYWRSEDELNVVVNVEITRNGREKYYYFKISNAAQVPKGYRMIEFQCAIPQHFEQATETLKTPPKTIRLKAFDWKAGPTDTESGEGGQKPIYKIDAECDFELLNK